MSLLCRALISYTLRDSCHLDQWAHKCHNPKVWGNYIHDELLLYTHTHTHTHLITQIKLQRLEWRRNKKSKGSLWQSSHCGPPHRERCLGSQGHVLTRAQGFRIPSPEDLKPTFRAVQGLFPRSALSSTDETVSANISRHEERPQGHTRQVSPSQRKKKEGWEWSQKVMLSPGQHISAGLWGVKTWPIRSCESLAVEAGD